MKKTLTNNRSPQLSQNIFSQQTNPTKPPQTLHAVRQDKRAFPRARIASLQPAPREKALRAHPSNHHPSRSQNRHVAKRRTVQLTLWVKPIVKAELERVAAQEGLSVSAAGGAFLQRALQQAIDMQYGALLQPIIENQIRKQMQAVSTRMALLLVRVAFASEQTRSLVTNVLGRMQGVTPEALNEILDRSAQAAKGKITYQSPQLEEMIEEVQQWFKEKDLKKPN